MRANRVNDLRNVQFDRYEVWAGAQKIGEGPRLTAI